MSENSLSDVIRSINLDSSLTREEKNRKIQNLIMHNWNQKNSGVECKKEDDDGMQVTYFDPVKKVFGCSHYQRSCKIKAKCCGLWFTCRLCHDEKVTSHKIDRHATEEMMCMACLQAQPIGAFCINMECGISMARYYCEVCKFFDDDPTRDIYHCSKCGICRRGKGEGIDFRHCDGCNACIAMNIFRDHKCIERSLESNCPICHEFMFTSTKSVVFMNCGHAIHESCQKKLLRSNFQCPICLKSMVDLSGHYKEIDSYVNNLQIPDEYKDHKTEILCNDCLKKSIVDFKFIYHKCSYCSSYNTSITKTFRGPSDPTISQP